MHSCQLPVAVGSDLPDLPDLPAWMFQPQTVDDGCFELKGSPGGLKTKKTKKKNTARTFEEGRLLGPIQSLMKLFKLAHMEVATEEDEVVSERSGRRLIPSTQWNRGECERAVRN